MGQHWRQMKRKKVSKIANHGEVLLNRICFDCSKKGTKLINALKELENKMIIAVLKRRSTSRYT
jgi:hypothetical protein